MELEGRVLAKQTSLDWSRGIWTEMVSLGVFTTGQSRRVCRKAGVSRRWKAADKIDGS